MTATALYDYQAGTWQGEAGAQQQRGGGLGGLLTCGLLTCGLLTCWAADLWAADLPAPVSYLYPMSPLLFQPSQPATTRLRSTRRSSLRTLSRWTRAGGWAPAVATAASSRPTTSSSTSSRVGGAPMKSGGRHSQSRPVQRLSEAISTVQNLMLSRGKRDFVAPKTRSGPRGPHTEPTRNRESATRGAGEGRATGGAR